MTGAVRAPGAAARAAAVAEVLGPPGAGKSTVLAALAGTGGPGPAGGLVVVVGFRGRRAGAAHLVAGGALVAAAPRACAELAGPRAPGPAEPGDDAGSRADRARWVLRLAAAPGVLAAERARGAGAVVFDQGPAYTLARLHPAGRREGPGACSRAGRTRWWETQVERCADLLDLVVLLDAPDGVLLDRIAGRAKDHALRGTPDAAARAALAGHRARITDVAERLAARAGGPGLLRVDTAATTPGRAADALERALAGAGLPGPGRAGSPAAAP